MPPGGFVWSASKIFNTEGKGRATESHGEGKHALRAVFDPLAARSLQYPCFLSGPQWPPVGIVSPW